MACSNVAARHAIASNAHHVVVCLLSLSNKIPCSTLFEPALPPLPAAPSTPLARVLMGIDSFCLCPHAVAWLLRDVNGEDVDGDGEREAIKMHKRAHLDEMLATLRRRLRRLASSKESEALAHAETEEGRITAQRSALAMSVVEAVPFAARRAAADFGIRLRAKKRK